MPSDLSVLNATEEYLESEDAVGRWITEQCKTGKSYRSSASELFASWKQWAELSGEFVGNLKKFSQDIDKRGYRKFRTMDERGFSGICLKGTSTQDEFPPDWQDVE